MDSEKTSEQRPSGVPAEEGDLLGRGDAPLLEPDASLEAHALLESSEAVPPDEAPAGVEGTSEGRPGGEGASTPPRSEAPAQEGSVRRIAIGAGVLALVLLVGAAFLWKALSGLGSLRQEVAVLKAQSQRSQIVQQRGSIQRARTELQILRQTLPADLAAEVDKAETVLVGLEERLKSSQ